MTRIILLVNFSCAAMNQLATLLETETMIELGGIDVPWFNIPDSAFLFENREMNQKSRVAQCMVQSLKLSNVRKVESKRMFLPHKRLSSTIKRSCYENSSGRRVGRRNGSR